MKRLLAVCLLALPSLLQAEEAYRGEWRGYVEFEGTYCFEDPLFPEQSNSNLSIAAEPE